MAKKKQAPGRRSGNDEWITEGRPPQSHDARPGTGDRGEDAAGDVPVSGGSGDPEPTGDWVTRGRPPATPSEQPPRTGNRRHERLTATSGGSGSGGVTILYIHGIANKPIASTLKCQWDTALFETRLGQRTRMAYWVNRRRYPIPLDADCGDHDYADVSFDTPEMAAAIQIDEEDQEPLRCLPQNIPPEHRATMEQIAQRMESADEAGDLAAFAEMRSPESEMSMAVLRPIRRWVKRRIIRAFLPDAYEYLFVPEERQRIDSIVTSRLAAGDRFIVIGHSLGSVIAYHVLASLQRRGEAPDVVQLVTLGSPLAMPEVQRGLRDMLGGDLPPLDCVRQWLNVSDRLDPVAVFSRLAGRFRCAGDIRDVTGRRVNVDSPRHPHSATGYLAGGEVRRQVNAIVGAEFSEEVTNFTLARDVADWIEDAEPAELHEVLVELKAGEDGRVDESRRRLMDALRRLLGDRLEERCVCLQRYLALRLTASEIETLGTQLRENRWGRVWQDAEKSALVAHSAATIHAPTAWRGYDALGQRIHWAVLDTGIRPDHPHFARHDNIAAIWDCTHHTAEPTPNEERRRDGAGVDFQGHGTHVAGVIAGQFPGKNRLPEENEPCGIAPLARLHSYKVLDDNGRGRDSWIIKAIQHIEEVNRTAGRLVIHGVNLSLGGDFDPEVYACGHSPLCNELRRLWRQGVVVVTSAGNLGSLTVESGGRRVRLNLDLSIGDPANLDESIAVGSVHKTRAKQYGVSYFSSRGPTADGRYKPDVVAPGERILSARADFHEGIEPSVSNLGVHYVELSGTSMAAPHVSGLLAAFLSQRRGLIGRPDELRQVMLDSCTDIGRDRYHQGAGVPNLIKMLLSVTS